MIAYEQKVPNDWLNWHIHVYWSSFYSIKISYRILIWETLTLFIEATVFVHLCFLFPYLIYSNGISRIPIDLQIWLGCINQSARFGSGLRFITEYTRKFTDIAHVYACNDSDVGNHAKKKKTKVASSISWHLIALYSK